MKIHTEEFRSVSSELACTSASFPASRSRKGEESMVTLGGGGGGGGGG